jgi:hypothetical protein
MSFMFELYYLSPEDKAREARLVDEVVSAGGRLDNRESADRLGGPIVLTFEFDSRVQAEKMAAALRVCGEHVETVCEYG